MKQTLLKKSQLKIKTHSARTLMHERKKADSAALSQKVQLGPNTETMSESKHYLQGWRQ